jgi:hypothetical protein
LVGPVGDKVLIQQVLPDRQRMLAIGRSDAIPTRHSRPDKEPPASPQLRSGGRYRIELYNEHQPASEPLVLGKTPMQAFLDALTLAKEKLMAA